MTAHRVGCGPVVGWKPCLCRIGSDHYPAGITETRAAAEAVAAGFERVAATIRWDGEPIDTAVALIDLGPLLVRFGQAMRTWPDFG